MIFKIKISYTILLIIFVLSCNNSSNTKTSNNSLIGKQLIIPDSLQLFNNYELYNYEDECSDAKITLIYHLNGGCNGCIEGLKSWNNLINNHFSNIDINIKIFAYTPNKELFSSFIKDIKVTNPIFIDTYDEFYFSNNLPPSQRFKMFLIDQGNTILAMDDLLNNSQSIQYFFGYY